jgi:hypothetical protein
VSSYEEINGIKSYILKYTIRILVGWVILPARVYLKAKGHETYYKIPEAPAAVSGPGRVELFVINSSNYLYCG